MGINRELVLKQYPDVDKIKVLNWLAFSPFTEEEIDWIVEYKKRIEFTDATISGNFSVNKTYRTTQVGWLHKNGETSWVYSRIVDCIIKANKQLWNFDIFGMYESFQYATYHKGHHYDWHMDTGVGKYCRKISASLQLTEPSKYEGCDLIIKSNKDEIPAPKKRGQLIVFPSFLLHKVTPLTKGSRDSLVIWISGPPFR